MAQFILSIEPVDGPSFRHGFHLGTVLAIARAEAEARFHGRNNAGLHTRTVALIDGRRIVDVYDGEWASERMF